jgi:hypothetical protein
MSEIFQRIYLPNDSEIDQKVRGSSFELTEKSEEVKVMEMDELYIYVKIMKNFP